MIRFIVLRENKHISGALTETMFTIDADVEKLEAALTSGGFGEDTYSICHLVGVEVR